MMMMITIMMRMRTMMMMMIKIIINITQPILKLGPPDFALGVVQILRHRKWGGGRGYLNMMTGR